MLATVHQYRCSKPTAHGRIHSGAEVAWYGALAVLFAWKNSALILLICHTSKSKGKSGNLQQSQSTANKVIIYSEHNYYSSLHSVVCSKVQNWQQTLDIWYCKIHLDLGESSKNEDGFSRPYLDNIFFDRVLSSYSKEIHQPPCNHPPTSQIQLSLHAKTQVHRHWCALLLLLDNMEYFPVILRSYFWLSDVYFLLSFMSTYFLEEH